MIVSRFFVCLAVMASASFAPRAAPQAYTCGGCIGWGGVNAVSGGSCFGSLSIQVAVESGRCRWFINPDTWIATCGQREGCTPTVTRTWSGMPANTPLAFCIHIGPDVLCLQTPPNSGPNGFGEDERVSAAIPCTSNSFTYSISSPSCGLSVSTEASCSACEISGAGE
jgi:hypothetical protein